MHPYKLLFSAFCLVVGLNVHGQDWPKGEKPVGKYSIVNCSRTGGFSTGKMTIKTDGSFKLQLVDGKKKLKCSGFWNPHEQGYLLTLDDANFLLEGLPVIGDQISLFDKQIYFGQYCIKLME